MSGRFGIAPFANYQPEPGIECVKCGQRTVEFDEHDDGGGVDGDVVNTHYHCKTCGDEWWG